MSPTPKSPFRIVRQSSLDRSLGRNGSGWPRSYVTHLDRAALASYCAAYALWVEATQAIQTYGATVKSPSGYPVQSPYVSIANCQTEIMMRITSEFGLTPASRNRISAPAAAQPSFFDKPSTQKR
jgi:P27 family predicted phage terminase small subunit